MIKMQQKPFAAIEKAEAKNVVVEERELRAHQDVQQIEPAMTFASATSAPDDE